MFDTVTETVEAKNTLKKKKNMDLLKRQTVGIPNGNASSRPRLEGIFLVCHGSRCGVDGLRFEQPRSTICAHCS